MTTRDAVATWLPWLGAAAAWALNLLAGAVWRVTPHAGAEINACAITAGLGAIVWTAFRKFSGPRLKPGQVIVSEDDLERYSDRIYQRATTQAIAELHGDRCPLTQQQLERLRAM